MLKCGPNIVPHDTSILVLPRNEISKTIPNGNLTGSLAPARHYLLILVENRNNMQIRKYSIYVGFSLATYTTWYDAVCTYKMVYVDCMDSGRSPISCIVQTSTKTCLARLLRLAYGIGRKENRGINEQHDWLASQAPHMLHMGV